MQLVILSGQAGIVAGFLSKAVIPRMFLARDPASLLKSQT